MNNTRIAFSLLAASSLIGCLDDENTAGTATTSQAATVSGRYIVKFTNAPAGRAAVLAAGGSIALELPAQAAAAAHLPAQALNGLQHHPAIEYIEEDAPRYRQSQETPYGVGMVNGADLPRASATSKKICIIDSGFNRGHEDLPPSGLGTNVDGTNVAGTGNWYEDTCGHGTHVAGTIAAVDNSLGVVGVAPGIALHIVKVFSGADCAWTYTSSLIAAANLCDAAEADVISMSLGGSFSSRTEDQAFASLYSKGVLLVAAAGNDGTTRKSYPASYASVISVAAIDEAKVVASFSQRNAAVELSAPGVGVRSTLPMGMGSLTSLLVGTTAHPAFAIDGSPKGNPSGDLVDCGIGSTGGSCPGATGKICLLARGTISFADKVLYCQEGGGLAAIIYNNVAGDLIATLDGVVTNIPSVTITQASGEAALAAMPTTATVSIMAENYAAWNGTSMATPHVSAVAALVWSSFPNVSNQTLRAALTATAEDLLPLGRDNSYGYGLVNAQAAFDYLTPASCTPTAELCTDGQDNDCDGLVDAADTADCGSTCVPVPEVCSNSVDDDCDGLVDASDTADCGPVCTLAPVGDSCTSNSQCCSNKCAGKTGKKTCK